MSTGKIIITLKRMYTKEVKIDIDRGSEREIKIPSIFNEEIKPRFHSLK